MQKSTTKKKLPLPHIHTHSKITPEEIQPSHNITQPQNKSQMLQEEEEDNIL